MAAMTITAAIVAAVPTQDSQVMSEGIDPHYVGSGGDAKRRRRALSPGAATVEG
jgi:hypothetical protein